MEQTGLVSSIRHDSLLLLSDENSSFAPPIYRPSPFYMLSFHLDRILAAAAAAGRAYPHLRGRSGLELLGKMIEQYVVSLALNEVQALKVRPYSPTMKPPVILTLSIKVRLVLPPEGNIEVSSTQIPATHMEALFPESLDDVLQAHPTYCIFVSHFECRPDFHTQHKTTNRSQYDLIRSVLPPAAHDDVPQEILLVNGKGEIMEGSFTTPYFRRDDRWITPAESSGGNIGVTRRWALERAMCVEGLVHASSIHAGSGCEKVVLSNGARGFGWGMVQPLKNEKR